MKQLDFSRFIDTVLELQRVRTITEQHLSEKSEDLKLEGEVRHKLANDFDELAAAMEFVGSRIAAIPAKRMANTLRSEQSIVSISNVNGAINDVQSRFRDECDQFSVFILSEEQSRLLCSANELVGVWDIKAIFPSAAAELEEASHCVAFGRYTAAVFHAMRMAEIAFKKIRDILRLEEASSGAQKNWSVALKEIKQKIDEIYPVSARTDGSDGKALEDIYASLDAIKNPWRNSTMHVENFYTSGDALHILRCVCVLLHKLAYFEFPTQVSEPDDDNGLEGTALETTA